MNIKIYPPENRRSFENELLKILVKKPLGRVKEKV